MKRHFWPRQCLVDMITPKGVLHKLYFFSLSWPRRPIVWLFAKKKKHCLLDSLECVADGSWRSIRFSISISTSLKWKYLGAVQFFSSSSFHLSSKTKYPRYPHLSVKRSRCSPISPPHFEGKSVSSPQWHLVAKETVASGILWTRKQHSKQLATEVLPNPSNLLRIRQLCDRLLIMSAKLPIVSIAQLLVWNWVTDIDCTPSSGLLDFWSAS